jgi:hypothetical protein
VIFDKLIQVLVFGCGYRRIAHASCSATTLRRRRDQWIALGLAEQLHQLALAAVPAPANRRDDGLLAATLDSAAATLTAVQGAPLVAATRSAHGAPGRRLRLPALRASAGRPWAAG